MKLVHQSSIVQEVVVRRFLVEKNQNVCKMLLRFMLVSVNENGQGNLLSEKQPFMTI